MNISPILAGARCVYALPCRHYSAFIAAKAMMLDDRRVTPTHAKEDEHDSVPSKCVLLGERL